MDENQVKQIVERMLSENQYSVSQVPFHEHLGTDSPKINIVNITGLNAGTGITLTSTGQSETISASSLIPTGAILPYGGTSATVVAGFLLCDGKAYSRATYATLFSVIGTTFGAGNGSTTFNIPDMRGNVPVGYANLDSNFGVLGGTNGSKTVTLDTTMIPSHHHGTQNMSGNGGGNSFPYYQGVSTQQTGRTMQVTDDTGGGLPHLNIQPSLVVNYIIKT